MYKRQVKDWDVIVVGTGVAGLAAACSALEAGAGNVLILEKSPVVGGHSILSTGYVAAAVSYTHLDVYKRQALERKCLYSGYAVCGLFPESGKDDRA